MVRRAAGARRRRRTTAAGLCQRPSRSGRTRSFSRRGLMATADSRGGRKGSMRIRRERHQGSIRTGRWGGPIMRPRAYGCARKVPNGSASGKWATGGGAVATGPATVGGAIAARLTCAIRHFLRGANLMLILSEKRLSLSYLEFVERGSA